MSGNLKAKTKNELEGLLVDGQEADVDRTLRRALEGKVAFERGTGRLLVRPGLFNLPQHQRLLALLLARHAMVRLGLSEAHLEADAVTLADEAQVSIKNCREYLSRLKAKRIVEKRPEGYVLPSWNVLLVAGKLADLQEEK